MFCENNGWWFLHERKRITSPHEIEYEEIWLVGLLHACNGIAREKLIE